MRRKARPRAQGQNKKGEERSLKRSVLRTYQANKYWGRRDLQGLVKARVMIASILLYLTGLRISNLLLIQRKHLDEWMNEGETTIQIINNGPPRKLICIGNAGQCWQRITITSTPGRTLMHTSSLVRPNLISLSTEPTSTSSGGPMASSLITS